MKTQTRMGSWALVVLAAFLTFDTSAPRAVVTADSAEACALVIKVASEETRPAPAPKSSAPSAEEGAKLVKKPGTAFKKLFKDVRPGSCPSVNRNVPGTSWPARGENAVAFCRP